MNLIRSMTKFSMIFFFTVSQVSHALAVENEQEKRARICTGGLKSADEASLGAELCSQEEINVALAKSERIREDIRALSALIFANYDANEYYVSTDTIAMLIAGGLIVGWGGSAMMVLSGTVKPFSPAANARLVKGFFGVTIAGLVAAVLGVAAIGTNKVVKLIVDKESNQELLRKLSEAEAHLKLREMNLRLISVNK